ncbi:MAG TPA: caspase family protein [Polyangiaceae bacterium]|nr:caspase family protein [Polyangiaceae bacterium]
MRSDSAAAVVLCTAAVLAGAWGCHKTTTRAPPSPSASATLGSRRLPPNARPTRPEGHVASVSCLQFSPDGRQLLTGSEDGSLLIWDWQQRVLLQRLEAVGGWVGSCAFFRDGKQVVSAGWRGGLFIWDARSGQVLRTPPALGMSGVMGIAVRGDSKRVAFATEDQSGEWDLETDTIRYDADSDGFEGTGYGNDGSRYVFGGGHTMVWAADGSAWRQGPAARQGAPLSSGTLVLGVHEGVELLDAHGDSTPLVRDPNLRGWVMIDLSPQGDRVVAAGVRGGAGIWRTSDGSQVCGYTPDHALGSVAFHPGGAFVGLGVSDGSVIVADARTCVEVSRMASAQTRVMSTAIGASLLVGDGAGQISSWDLTSFKRTWAHRVHAREVSALAALPGGDWASGAADGTVRVGTGPSSKQIGVASDVVSEVKVGLRGDLFVADLDGGVTRVHDGNGEVIFQQERHRQVLALALDDQATSLFVAGAYPTLTKLQLLEQGAKPIGNWPDHLQSSESTASLALDSTGRVLAQGGTRGTILLRNSETGEILRSLTGMMGRGKSIVFDRDWLWAGGDDGRLLRWTVASASDAPDRSIEVGGRPTDIARSPDGSILAVGNTDGRVTVHALPAGDLVATLFPLREGSWASVRADGRVELKGKLAEQLLFEVPSSRRVIALGAAAGHLTFTSPNIERLADGTLFVRTTVLSPTGAPHVEADGCWTVHDIQPSPTVLSAYDLELAFRDHAPVAHLLTAEAPGMERVQLRIDPPPVLQRGRVLGRALLVANSAYLTQPLPGASKDVNTLASALSGGSSWGLQSGDSLLVRENLGADLLSTVAQFFANATADETLLFYFAGHGGIQNGDAYLYPVAAKGASDPLSGSISTSTLWSMIGHCKAKQVLVILDACQAGAFTLPGNIGQAMQAATGAPPTAVLAATAGSAQETAQGGRFTAALVRALGNYKGADNEGRVKALDAFAYVLGEVREQLPQWYGSPEAMRIPLAWPEPPTRIVEASKAAAAVSKNELIGRVDQRVVSTRQLVADVTTHGQRGQKKDRWVEVELYLNQNIDGLRVAVESVATHATVYENFVGGPLVASKKHQLVEYVGDLAPGPHEIVLQACKAKSHCDSAQLRRLPLSL